MTNIEISCVLPVSPDEIWEHVKTSRLLDYITKGMIRFKPIAPKEFPEIWEPGQYKAALYWKGIMPVGWQVIQIESIPERDGVRFIRDNGYGALIKTWDHMIEIAPHDDGTKYTDRITVRAGLLTPLVALFAKRFYIHRQKRWRRLVKNNFDYSK